MMRMFPWEKVINKIIAMVNQEGKFLRKVSWRMYRNSTIPLEKKLCKVKVVPGTATITGNKTHGYK